MTPRPLTIVIKVGTSSICSEVNYMPNLANLALLVDAIVNLRAQHHSVILVSSGAVALGLRRLGLTKRPKTTARSQAVAAVGQGRLMALYDTLFGLVDVAVGQILVTRDNMCERGPYLNARNTVLECLALGSLPIINENDSVTASEIRFGDNDTLSAIVAGMVDADFLFLLTDVDGLYTNNPRVDPLAERVAVVDDIAELRRRVNVLTTGSAVGTGGMVTKLIAAELAVSAGCAMVITLGTFFVYL